MIWFAKRDRSLEAYAEAIQPELAGIRTPPASAELRDRILADRAAGARVILPAERDTRWIVPRYLIAAVAVVTAVLVLPLSRATDATRDAEPVALAGFLGGIARAEQPSATPKLPAALPIRPERVHAGTLQYRRVFNDSTGRVAKTIESVLSVSADSAPPVPVWRVTTLDRETSSGGLVTSAETLLIKRQDLSLVSRAVHVRPYRRWNGINIQQRVIGDSLSGRMTLDDVEGMRPIARRLPFAYGPYISDALAPLYLTAVPLDATWQGSLTVLGWAVVSNDVLHPMELRVTGQERVHVPAGTFDCWRLTVRHSGGVIDYWVRKSDGIGVRAVEQNSPTGGERIVTLVRESGM
jgi:hypothetical protein